MASHHAKPGKGSSHEPPVSPARLKAHAESALRAAHFSPRLRKHGRIAEIFKDVVLERLTMFFEDRNNFQQKMSPAEVSAAKCAARFLALRYEQLGIDLPETELLMGVDPDKRFGQGLTLSRSGFVSSSEHIGINPKSAFFRSIWVHEVSHALGRIDVVAAPWREEGFAVPRQGCVVQNQKNGEDFFLLFEEYAASAHQQAYFSTHGGRVHLASGKKTLRFEPHIPGQREAQRLLSDIYFRYQAHRNDTGTPTVLTPISASDQQMRFHQSFLQLSEGAFKVKGSNECANMALDLLAGEIYPEMEVWQAASRFRDDTCRVQAGAPHSIISVPIKSALGNEALKLLSSLETSLDNRATPILLAMYTDAGRLPPKQRDSIRTRIFKLALEE